MELWCEKNRFEKYLIFEKSEHFENGQSWPRCKGYSLWKMVSLGQKLKNAKKVRKTILLPHWSCGVQKNGSEKPLIFEKSEHFENGQNWSRRKGAKDDSTTTLELWCAKNRSEKHLIFEE